MALPKPAGSCTYEDLVALPDAGKRYEMPAPGWDHVAVVMNLVLLLRPVVRALGGQIATVPVDAFFQGADQVQPDMLAILPGSSARGHGRGLEGAPDLDIEVLSPSNRGHDLLTRRALYARGGVREYWIVDPANRTVEVLVRDRDAFHTRQLARIGDEIVSHSWET